MHDFCHIKQLLPYKTHRDRLSGAVTKEIIPAADRRPSVATRRNIAGAAAGIVPVREEVTKLLGAVKQQADGFAAYAETAYRGQTKACHRADALRSLRFTSGRWPCMAWHGMAWHGYAAPRKSTLHYAMLGYVTLCCVLDNTHKHRNNRYQHL